MVFLKVCKHCPQIIPLRTQIFKTNIKRGVVKIEISRPMMILKLQIQATVMKKMWIIEDLKEAGKLQTLKYRVNGIIITFKDK